MTRIVALGDSITLGMGDPVPGGGWQGWAQYLASGLSGPELHNLARMRAVNAELDKVAAHYGTLHWDASSDPETYDRRNWSVDRLHPNERGHRLIACRFWDRLAAAGHEVTGRPDAEPAGPGPTGRGPARARRANRANSDGCRTCVVWFLRLRFDSYEFGGGTGRLGSAVA